MSDNNNNLINKLQDLTQQIISISSTLKSQRESSLSSPLHYNFFNLQNLFIFIKFLFIFFNLFFFIFLIYLQKRKVVKETIEMKIFNKTEEQLIKEQLEENDNTNTELTQQQDANNNLKEENEQKELKEEDNERNVGIVIAHPDDEAMFFTPLIQSLNEMNNNLNNLNTHNTDSFKNKKNIKIHLLCLSSGNANGIGKERIFELEKSCKILNILNQNEHVKVILNNNTLINKDNLINNNNTLINKERMKGNCIIIEDEELLDGMDKIWNLDKISWLVEEFVEQNKITKIFTFDKFGISNHPNHIATFNGIIKFKLKTLQKQNQIDCYQLITNNNIFRKYSSIFEFVTSLHFNNENTITLFTPQFLKSWKAMKAHESQFVWFRKLFILFSTYTYVNTFTKIE
ncbi:hypothetical protein ABK040_007639 [Willaertia magna]